MRFLFSKNRIESNQADNQQSLSISRDATLVDVKNLRIERADGAVIVDDVSFSIKAGEIVGLVGESGSGKTTIATSLLGYVRKGAAIIDGEIIVSGMNIRKISAGGLKKIRGIFAGYVAQDPAMALNPLLRIRVLLSEMLETHLPDLSVRERAQRICEVVQEVGLPEEDSFLDRFPHQLSGGQQQRVLLALAFITRPNLIILDEPTTALDVTTQSHVLETIKKLCSRHHVAALYVSHDLAVVRDLVDRLIVLYAGRIVEMASGASFFDNPRHPYSHGLLAAIPDISHRKMLIPIPGHAPAPGQRVQGCGFANRCARQREICVSQVPALITDKESVAACFYPIDTKTPQSIRASIEKKTVHTLHPYRRQSLLEIRSFTAAYGARPVLFNVDMDLFKGSCTALVGESGSGKTTFARALVGLGADVGGRLVFDGSSLPIVAEDRSQDQRRRIQYVFQNPYRSLNPRRTVGKTLLDAIYHFHDITPAIARVRMLTTLEQVSLPPTIIGRYPRELSGGERQRIAIARALLSEPDVLICDEITSALDVSVQASILQLLQTLQSKGLTILFVTHDMAVVRAIADNVVVLKHGNVVESGPLKAVFDNPQSDYARELINQSPSLSKPNNSNRFVQGERI